MKRLDYKMSKVEETDIVKQWTTKELTRTNIETLNVIETKIKELEKATTAKLELNLLVPGLIGENEDYVTFSEYIAKNHEKTQKRFAGLETADQDMVILIDQKTAVVLDEVRGRLDGLNNAGEEKRNQIEADLKKLEDEIHKTLECTRAIRLPNVFVQPCRTTRSSRRAATTTRLASTRSRSRKCRTFTRPRSSRWTRCSKVARRACSPCRRDKEPEGRLFAHSRPHHRTSNLHTLSV